MNVLLVDDHPLFSVGFVHALQATAEHLHVRAVDSVDAGLTEAGRWPELNLVIVDYRLPDEDGLVGIGRFARAFPHLARLLISGIDEECLTIRARLAGAQGLVTKSSNLTEVIDAMQAVVSGQEWFHALDRHACSHPDPTTRQLEVLDLVAQGLPNKSIASRLSIAERTVKLHVTALLETMNARNRTHLLVIARERGLIG
ncbi:response regulator transcription factor [Ideonella sp. DXS29W]|uniref:Response regulator transcription factor n=1 Tax=Ideonella lacteola TaxID=2984193 RepID=A0ABU9BR21_9BURK